MKTKILLLLVLVLVLTLVSTSNAVDVCSCFPVAPHRVLVDVNGIERGEWWDDSYPPSPNQRYVLYNVGGCRYMGGYDAPEHHISFVWQADESYLQISVGGMYLIFAGTNPPCSTFFVSEMTTHEWYFYGGSVYLKYQIGDFDGDFTVDFIDFALLVNDWLYDCSDPNVYNDPNRSCSLGTDLTGDGEVNWNDMQIFQQYWMKSCLE